MRAWTRTLVVLLVGSALALGACARVENPATGEMEFTTLSPEQERQIGEQQHPVILQQFGGAYSDQELQTYVEQIGEKLAAQSDLPDLDFTFTLLNTEVVNAFALPGGYVYVTRGLLALAENEAELAGVVGHEIAHVTARHSAQRQTQAQTAGILGTLGSIGAAVLLGETAGQVAQQVAGAGAQAWVASYSRDQEFEADDLGIRYMTRAGYDPRAMSSFLQKLDAQSALDQQLAGREGDPAASWFATHPRTLDRVERAANEAAAGAGDGRLERDAYLNEIDGMIYGPDPSQGFVEDGLFVHPELGFAFEAPPGFQLQNTPQAVLGQDQDGRLMVFTLAAAQDGDLGQYVAGPGLRRIAESFQGQVSQPRNVQTFTVNGLPAASSSATLRTQGGEADVGLATIDQGERRYDFIFLSPGTMSRDAARAFQTSVNSFRALSDQESGQYQPRRIGVVRVGGDATGRELAQRMAVEQAPLERFQILNARAREDGLEPQERVKLIVR